MRTCQDIAGILPKAENAADIEVLGTDLELPGDSPGYTVTGVGCGRDGLAEQHGWIHPPLEATMNPARSQFVLPSIASGSISRT